MSGGSWDYLYIQVEEAAQRLIKSEDPLRRAFGHRLSLCADALHDIEWVDSNDYGKGQEKDAIENALDDVAAPSEMIEILCDLHKAADRIQEIIRDNQ